ncbi:MAG TPA: hypothetical protein DDW52_00075, partial [Planctomycetaceae bacterium]|nr:hypothetical protein [Planctomycetaceae bacterium]
AELRDSGYATAAISLQPPVAGFARIRGLRIHRDAAGIKTQRREVAETRSDQQRCGLFGCTMILASSSVCYPQVDQAICGMVDQAWLRLLVVPAKAGTTSAVRL